MSYLTGLRKKELASLTPGSFDLAATPPTLTVEATVSKHRRKDVLPLHPELVAMLPRWLKGLAAGQKFSLLARRKAARMVKKDLKRTASPTRQKRGLPISMRRAGIAHHGAIPQRGVAAGSKRTGPTLGIKTTLRYTHIGIKDQARAVAAIPVPKKLSDGGGKQPGKEDAGCTGMQLGCRRGAFAVSEWQWRHKRQTPKP